MVMPRIPGYFKKEDIMSMEKWVALGGLIIILLPILTYFMSKAAVLGRLQGTRYFIKLYGKDREYGKEKQF